MFGDTMKKVFIDGSAGTTGLRIFDRLAARKDIQLLVLDEAVRKDEAARREALNSSDIAFLCLPDAAAVQAADWVENPQTVLIDTSTAHRTLPGWAYGFPELSQQHRQTLRSAKRIAVPGCHASGFIALIFPLLQNGLLAPDVMLTCHSLTGYSGGGKSMIAAYESAGRPALLDAPRQYALGQKHKHLKEMCAISGLAAAPVFCPIVADFYSGMLVTVPLFARQLRGTVQQLRALYAQQYAGSVVRYRADMEEDGFLSAAGLSGRDSMEITVAGNEDRILLMARYDNLGKGASGAAVQCLNLVLGAGETQGLLL